MIPTILMSTAGDLLDTVSIGIAGSYEVLTLFILLFIFIITYLFGRHVFALLATSLAVIGMAVWGSDINQTLLAIVATIFGVLIVFLFKRVGNK